MHAYCLLLTQLLWGCDLVMLYCVHASSFSPTQAVLLLLLFCRSNSTEPLAFIRFVSRQTASLTNGMRMHDGSVCSICWPARPLVESSSNWNGHLLFCSEMCKVMSVLCSFPVEGRDHATRRARRDQCQGQTRPDQLFFKELSHLINVWIALCNHGPVLTNLAPMPTLQPI